MAGSAPDSAPDSATGSATPETAGVSFRGLAHPGGWVSGGLATATARTAWWRFLLVCAIPMGAAPFFLASQWRHTAANLAIAYLSALACVWRCRSGRGVPKAWLWIGAGVALNASGGIWEAVALPNGPSGADGLYLLIYPFMAIGLLMIVRSRHPGMGAVKLIDASTLTVGMGLLCWVFLIHPQTIGASPVLSRIVDISYPVGDLVLLAILARVVVAEGWRTPTVRLLLLALLAFLLGDSIWAFVNQVGFATTGRVESIINETFMAAYALVGAAALHPSSRELDTAMPVDDERVSHTLFILLTAASLVAPAVLTGQAIHGHVTDGIAISVCSVQLTALVLARMGYLLSHVQKQSARLRDLALEDPLTGLPNRRALQSHLANSLQKARREQIALTVAMIDLDHFKAFNDQFGHLAGDHLLKSAASAWAAQVRGTDMLARVGGEEFVLVLPDATVSQAEGVVTKLRGVTPLGQTFSAGLAQWDGEALLEELVNAADTAMYAAKHAGRNRTERAAGTAPARVGTAAAAAAAGTPSVEQAGR